MKPLKIAKMRKRKPPALEGERLLWFELASHLRMTVSDLQDRIEYSEFLEWIQYLRIERNSLAKIDHYLAQIAMEVRRSYVKDPNRVKLSSFLMKFSTPEEAEVVDSAKDPRSVKTAVSKAAWFGALGMQIPREN